jgi:YidC/Oxa1 family membrane protein insertase
MSQKGIIVIVVAVLAAYFLYEPVVDRFFTDTSLRVSETQAASSEAAETIHINTELMDVALSPFGARITSVRLLQYQTGNGEPVELISGLLKTRSGIRIELPQVLQELDERLYNYKQNGKDITFQQTIPQGLEIQKSYSPADGYAVTFKLDISNRSEKKIDLPEGVRIIPFYSMEADHPRESKKLRAAWMDRTLNGLEREKAKKIKQPLETEDPIAWIGIQNRYFTQVFIPEDPNHTAMLHPLGEWQAYPALDSPAFSLEPGQSYSSSYVLYLGPAIEEELRQIHNGLEKIVDYGTFEFLGKGVLLLLQWIHRYIANYGLCLILLALALRILLLPLAHYNLRSLREMPRVLQQIYDIEEEEKDHPERAEDRIRPLRQKQIRATIGSFLPLAIQIPIFLALYQVLHSSLELRHAEFVFWIHDLSVRDPVFILPLLMGLAMILQQRLTSANPGSDKTWIWMPLGFALLFSFFPAGLVLFWFADTLLAVIQLSWIAIRSPER